MEKIVRCFILSIGFLLYPKIGETIQPSNQPTGLSRQFEVRQAQASVIRTNQTSSQMPSDDKETFLKQKKREEKEKKLVLEIREKQIATHKKEIALQYIRQALWAGNYRTGENGLAAYKKNFGVDENYLTEKARLLALTNHSKEALVILEPLLKKESVNTNLLDIKNYAEQHPGTEEQIPTINFLSELSEVQPNQAESNQLAMMKDIRQKLWIGNYRAGENKLSTYKTKFGADKNYLTEKARLFALTNHSKEALIILEPLLKKDANNKNLLDIKNYALKHPEITEQLSPNIFKLPVHIEMPHTDNPLLKLAETQSSKGEFAKSAHTYQKYLETHPQDKTIILTYIRTELWSANYNAAQKALDAYQQKFGINESYLTEKARLFALTSNSKNALLIIDALLKKYPQNKTLLDIKNYALKHPNPLPIKNVALAKSSSQIQPTLQIAQTLENKAIECGYDPELYLKASLAYSAIKAFQKALCMINCAVALAPCNINYLNTKADIAKQLSNFTLALNSYYAILKMKPNDATTLLNIAQTQSAQGDLTASATTYSLYVSLYPFNENAWLEYANVEGWSGNYRKAFIILKECCQLFGETFAYLKTKGLILAQSARPRAACAIIMPLLKQSPNNIDLNQARVTALYYNNQPIEMFENLHKFQYLSHNNAIAKDVTEFVVTPYRTNVNLDLFHSKDVDTVCIEHETLKGQFFITPLTQVLSTVKGEHLSANQGSGLEPIQGGNGLTISEETLGINHRINCAVDLEAAIGHAHVNEGQNAFVYYATANLQPADTLFINVLEKQDYYDVSARAVSLNIRQQLNQVIINWEPTPQRYLNLQSSYSTFTDSNTMWYVIFSPKLGVLRNEKLNLDVGLSSLLFGFSEQVTHGYYDPRFYQYHAITTSGYWKQSTNVGYGFSIGLGQQKDETFRSYKFGGDLSINGYFGIYKDWMLVVTAAASNRGRSIGTNSLENSNYKIWAFDATITRRF